VLLQVFIKPVTLRGNQQEGIVAFRWLDKEVKYFCWCWITLPRGNTSIHVISEHFAWIYELLDWVSRRTIFIMIQRVRLRKVWMNGSTYKAKNDSVISRRSVMINCNELKLWFLLWSLTISWHRTKIRRWVLINTVHNFTSLHFTPLLINHNQNYFRKPKMENFLIKKKRELKIWSRRNLSEGLITSSPHQKGIQQQQQQQRRQFWQFFD
jgi:hypothetical protein